MSVSHWAKKREFKNEQSFINTVVNTWDKTNKQTQTILSARKKAEMDWWASSGKAEN